MSAAALYLHLQARGLRLEMVERPDHPDGTGSLIRVRGYGKLGPGERERCERLILANKPALIILLGSGSSAALAVRGEGHDSGAGRVGA